MVRVCEQPADLSALERGDIHPKPSIGAGFSSKVILCE